MRALILSAAMVLLPSLACAQQYEPISYIEFSAGAAFIPGVTTTTYTFSDGVNTATGHGTLNYSTAMTAGAELGVAGYAAPDIRLAVAYDYLHADLHSAKISGTVNGVPGSITFSRGDVASAGLNFDDDAHVVTGSAYYNLPLVGDIRPYIGAGVGVTFLQHADAQLTFTGTVGFRAALSEDAYIGVRYRYYRINAPTDDLGIQYNAINAHSVMAVLGFYLP